MKLKFNRDLVYVTVIIGLIAALSQLYFSFNIEPALVQNQGQSTNVYYSKHIEANQLLIEKIQAAQTHVYFAIYTFTRSDIKDALLAAKYRGLDVQGVVDKQQTEKIDEQDAIVKELQAVGIPIVFQDHSAIMHLKVLVTDQAYVSGSYNWTASATTANDEVLEIGTDPLTRSKYETIVKELIQKYQAQTL